MMIGRIAFIVLFIGPILQIVGASNGHCPAPVSGMPACQSNLPQITTDINYLLAYDSEERKERVQAAFAAIRNSVHTLIKPIHEIYGILDVWLGQSANFTILTARGNATSDVIELTPQIAVIDVRHCLEMVPRARSSYTPTVKYVIIVIEFLPNPCPSIADCQNVTNSLCHDQAAYVFYVSLAGSPAPGIEHLSNCICSHLAQTQTPSSQFCVPVTPVAGWSPTPGTIYKYTTPPPTMPTIRTSRKRDTDTDTDDPGSTSTLFILLSIGIVFMVISCIVVALAVNKFRLAKDHPVDEAVSPGKVSATSRAHEPGHHHVSPKKSGYGGLADPTPKVQSSTEADVPQKKSAHGSMKGPSPNISGTTGSVVAKSQRKEVTTPGDKTVTLNTDATKSASKSVSKAPE